MKKRINILMFIMVIFTIFSFTGCNKNNTSSIDDGIKKTFTINVESIGGKKLSNVAVEIYNNEELVRSVVTNDNGTVEVLLENQNYTVELRNLPKGYYTEKPFNIMKGTFEYEFEVLSFVADGEAPKGTKYSLGDVMYDFTVTDSDGEEFNLQSYLEEYSAVVINFWFETCLYCAEEFPIFEEAYQEYKNDVALIALNIYEDIQTVANYKYDNDLSFPMACDSAGIQGLFGFSGAPQTIFIDRYGVIAYIYEGGIEELTTFTSILDLLIVDNYYPITNTDENEEDKRIPNVNMPSSDDIGAVINGEGFNATYSITENEEDLGYAWPWIISTDGNSIQPSKTKINSTAATIIINTTIPEGKALSFDYLVSTEKDYDVLYVIVDGVLIHTISGVENDWKTCFAYVSEETRNYEVTLCYFKDENSFEGEDTIYINNMKIVSIDDINTPTYIYRYCSSGLDTTTYNYDYYVDTYYNDEDGYFHVDSEDGPLVLADLIYATNWSEEVSLLNIASNGYAIIDNVDYGSIITEYASYAGNGKNGYTPITYDLYEAIITITNYWAQNDNEFEWLEVCGYYDAYGTNGVEMEDPTIGLATHNAFKAEEGDQNFAHLYKPIVPRGYKFEFVPSKSGAYKINSFGTLETLCWILDENGKIIAESSNGARKYRLDENAALNFEMYYYFEEGKTYFINPAYGDYYDVGYLQFNIEYIGESYEILTLCSPGYFTTGLDAFGNMTDEIIAGGIDVIYNSTDGYYHELREDGSIGSIIYADFEYFTFIFPSDSLMDLIDKKDKYGNKGFDFRYNEEGVAIEGGEDLTELAKEIAATRYTEGELKGCVPVTLEVKNLLQNIMDKYTFAGVENSWTKLCYYYQYFGPSAQ